MNFKRLRTNQVFHSLLWTLSLFIHIWHIIYEIWSEFTVHHFFCSKNHAVYQSLAFLSHKPPVSICWWGIFLNCTCLDGVFFLKAPCVVLVYIPLSYWEHRHTYIFSWGLYFHYMNRKQTIFREEADLLVLPISSLCCFRPAEFSVAGWNICFCCFKNCLFVLTITPWCFSFYFTNLSKVIIQFQVFQGSEFLETQYDHLLKAGVYIRLQSAHLWHFRAVVPEEACSLSVTCCSNMLA